MLNGVNAVNSVANHVITPKNVAFRGTSIPCDNFQRKNVAKIKTFQNANKCSFVLGLLTGAAIRTINPSKIKQLASKIKFQEAKTMDEAKKFAKDNFSIELDLGDNLFTANMVNEMCTKISNKFKGKAAFPEKFMLKEDSVVQSEGRKYRGVYSVADNAIVLNKQKIAGTFKAPDNGETLYLSDWLNGLLERGKNYGEVLKEWENSPFEWQKNAIYTMRKCIAHEIGHCNHFSANKFQYWISALRDKEFKKDLNKQEIQEYCRKYFPSEYHKTNPLEFVAETFAQKMLDNRTPLPLEIMYLKYGGVKV